MSRRQALPWTLLGYPASNQLFLLFFLKACPSLVLIRIQREGWVRITDFRKLSVSALGLKRILITICSLGHWEASGTEYLCLRLSQRSLPSAAQEAMGS